MSIKEAPKDNKDLEVQIAKAREARKQRGIESVIMKQYIPEGFHGRFAYGKENIARYQAMGYTILKDENGKPRCKKGNSLEVLMVIDKRIHKVLQQDAKSERRVQQTLSSEEITKQLIDPSTQKPVFSNN